MKYVIEEEELKDLVSGYYTFSGQPVYKWVNDFLKSKTPVEVIASGEVKGKYQGYVGDKSIYNIENKIISYQGKNIEIAVRVKQNS